MTVKEKYVCACWDGRKGRNHVYYLCRFDCGKEVIFSGDEISLHPYSCGCTPRPKNCKKMNKNSHGLKVETMLYMPRPTRAVYSNCTLGISGVSYEKRREKWRAQIVLRGKNHFLGYFDKKEDAIKVRIEGKRKY